MIKTKKDGFNFLFNGNFPNLNFAMKIKIENKM